LGAWGREGRLGKNCYIQPRTSIASLYINAIIFYCLPKPAADKIPWTAMSRIYTKIKLQH